MKFPTLNFSLTPKRRQELIVIFLILIGIAVALGLTLYALRQNINVFYTPTQVLDGEAPEGKIFRVGGLVQPGSVERDQDGLRVSFRLSDTATLLTVTYTGILPDLFKEGQGIVANGVLTEDKTFVAREVLAKHDEKYMPPEVKGMLGEISKDNNS